MLYQLINESREMLKKYIRYIRFINDFILSDTSPKPDAPLPVKAESDRTVVAVVSTIAACLLIVIIIIIFIKCRKSNSKATDGDAHGMFREDVLNKARDGSIHAHNPLHNLYDNADVTIQNDSVQYHPNNDETNSALAFSNINYDSMHFSLDHGESDNEISDDHAIEHKDTKPLGVKPDFEDSSYASMSPNYSASGINVYDSLRNKTYHSCVTVETTGHPKDQLTRSLSECREISPPE